MKPIAAPSIGGMVSSSLHVLFMTPCLFVIGEDIRQLVAPPRRAPRIAGSLRLVGRLLRTRLDGRRRLDGDVEMRRIHDAVPLKLHPDAIHARARKNQIELHLGTGRRR